jgi:hypothetical protein
MHVAHVSDSGTEQALKKKKKTLSFILSIEILQKEQMETLIRMLL